MYILRTGGILALATAMAINTTSSGSADIVVGGNFSLTGPNSSLGIPCQNGIPLLPEEIAGEPVRYVVLDDASDPSIAVRNIRKLVDEEKVDVIVGPTGAPTAFAVASILNEIETPMASSAPIDIFGEGAHWFVSVVQPADVWMPPVVKHMKEQGFERVAFIGFSDTWGDIGADALRKYGEEAGLVIVAEERYARADSSVSGQIVKILSSRPDAIFIGASGSPNALPLIALQERGWAGQTYNSVAAFNQQFLQVAGPAAEGTIVSAGPIGVAHQLQEDNPIRAVATNFVDEYEAANGLGSANVFAGYCHDAFLIVQAAIPGALEKAEPGTAEFRKALRDEIKSVPEIVGTHGVYNFKEDSPYGADERAAVLIVVQDGEWKLLSR